MTEKHLAADPRGLIREAYRIEGITEAECRSIFFGWLFGIEEEGTDNLVNLVATLHHHYATDHPNHPMTHVLAEGQLKPTRSPRHRRRRP